MHQENNGHTEPEDDMIVVVDSDAGGKVIELAFVYLSLHLTHYFGAALEREFPDSSLPKYHPIEVERIRVLLEQSTSHFITVPPQQKEQGFAPFSGNGAEGRFMRTVGKG